jgi:hypothetical protein
MNFTKNIIYYLNINSKDYITYSNFIQCDINKISKIQKISDIHIYFVISCSNITILEKYNYLLNNIFNNLTLSLSYSIDLIQSNLEDDNNYGIEKLNTVNLNADCTQNVYLYIKPSVTNNYDCSLFLSCLSIINYNEAHNMLLNYDNIDFLSEYYYTDFKEHNYFWILSKNVTNYYDTIKNNLSYKFKSFSLNNIRICDTAETYTLISRKYNKFYNNIDYVTDDINIQRFRNICSNSLKNIRNLYLPNFKESSIYESVLVEYRCLPHLEFIIRNTIIKLGEKWCHTIVCGNFNYEYILYICSFISDKIKIIKTNRDNLSPSEYSMFLTTLEFWNLLNGEKILIYQEDSIIFKNNIDEFLHLDYVGAPWPKNQNDTINLVGNGGISLRTKSIMTQIISHITPRETKYNSDTLAYMKNTNSVFPPEDVYFCINMEKLNIGKIADYETASNFSTESIVNLNSFAGHKFWINDIQWENRIFKNVITQFKPNYCMEGLYHRGGWKSILLNLISNQFYNENSNIEFIDIVESQFLWKTYYACHNKWCGIIHCTPSTPPYLDNANISNLFKNKNFLKSLNTCIGLFTLNSYITSYMSSKLNDINVKIPIHTLKHPVVSDGIIQFDYTKYKNNKNKKIIQIGQKLSKMSSIYLLEHTNSFEKIWLSGTKDRNKCNLLFERELKFLGIDNNIIESSSVVPTYIDDIEKYDLLLSKNVVFIDLFDAAANNTVLECIVRNTPIIVNKLPPIFEYLGQNYPLYFDKLDEVQYLLTDQQILKAHLYLKELNKTDITIKYFTEKLMNICSSLFQ